MTNYNERLDEILEQAYLDGASDTMWQDDKHVETFATAKKELQAIIRNEKLKLLAEIRERVVGEDVEPHHELCTMKSCVCSNGTRNDLRKKQKTELTQLEAEL